MATMTVDRAPDLFFAGALIYRRDEDGELVPTWWYRAEKFREAFFASGLTVTEVERRGGWEDGRFSRVIGLREQAASRKNGRVYRNRTERLSYRQAVRVARALDLDFVMWEL